VIDLGLGYSDLYSKVRGKLNVNISHTDFTNHLVGMVQDRMIIKQGKKYIISNMARRAKVLGISGFKDQTVERNLALCLFLLVCDRIFKPKPISESELNVLLNYVYSKNEDLGSLESSNIITSDSNCRHIMYKQLSTISLGVYKLDKGNGKISSSYSYMEEGSTAKEVFDLLKGPRNYPIFIDNKFGYTQMEIKDHMKLLLNASELRLTPSYDKQEERCTAGDPLSETRLSVQEMIDNLWETHILEFDYLRQKGTLTDYEKEGLRILLGGVGSYKFFNETKSQKKTFPNRELEFQLKMISSAIDHKICKFYSKYQDFLKSNYLYSVLVNRLIIRNSPLKGICAFSAI
jgi:hypothetical protein